MGGGERQWRHGRWRAAVARHEGTDTLGVAAGRHPREAAPGRQPQQCLAPRQLQRVRSGASRT
eukprot:6879052-Prymnesium_polylepis.1